MSNFQLIAHKPRQRSASLIVRRGTTTADGTACVRVLQVFVYLNKSTQKWAHISVAFMSCVGWMLRLLLNPFHPCLFQRHYSLLFIHAILCVFVCASVARVWLASCLAFLVCISVIQCAFYSFFIPCLLFLAAATIIILLSLWLACVWCIHYIEW